MRARLAWRSIWRHRRRTIITVVSIAFGLACVIFFLSLNEGVYAQLVDDAVRMQAGHVTVEHPEYREAPAIDLTVRDSRAIADRMGRWEHGAVYPPAGLARQACARRARGLR